MRKEIVIAIVIGLFVGLIVAYGVRMAQHSLESRQLASQQNTTTDNNATVQALSTDHTLFITTPEPNMVTDKNSITIVGTTTPLSLLSIISNLSQIATVADDAGNFAATIDLSGGVNSVAVTSYNETGAIAESSFMIIYTTADLNATESATTNEE